ncbi:MAG: hypothetical protein E6G56_14715 [Actinobacteria bacterium]|nr:MAG: hypothetical protein E6G56_14715 [Actinomycetota bacterium]
MTVVGGCGGSNRHRPTEFPNAGPGVGQSIRTANCSDWKRGSAEQRRRTVAQLRNFAGGPVGSSSGLQNGPVLDDQRAYKLLDSYCARYLARGFKLYKLYDRAAAFLGHAAPN